MPNFTEHIPEEDHLNLRSEEVHEILSHIPSWIIRYGISAIFGTLILILIASWYIKYPEIIPSRAVITTARPPSPIVARTSGKLERLFVTHNQFVEKDTYLAVVENAANIDEVLKFRTMLNNFVHFFNNTEKEYPVSDFLYADLGELQLEYSSFSQSYSDYIYFKNNSYYTKKIEQIKQQIVVLEQLTENIKTQKQLSEKEHTLAFKKFEKDKSLYKKSLISELELSQSERSYISVKSALETAESSLLSNQLQHVEYSKTLADLENQYTEQKRNHINLIRASYKQLKNRFELFERNYVLKAPNSGTVSLLGYWSENQYVQVGDRIMYIVTDDKTPIGKINLTVMGAGKVQVGQTVKIKLDQYKFDEFGVLIGKIKSISLVPNKDNYIVDVEFPDGLNTTYNKVLDYKPEMQGLAEIVTEDLRLLERIFNQLRSILNNS